MTQRGEEKPEAARVLRGCLNDLIIMMALPALWRGREPHEILGALLDSLVRMLQLEFAEANLADGFADAAISIRRPDGAAPDSPSGLSVATFHLGVRDAVGVLVVGARRPGFPSETERLLVQVGANQAAIGLQEARRRNDQRRDAEQLERRVIERTEELTRVNSGLRLEISEHRRGEQERLMLAALVANSTDFIGIASLAGDVLFINAAGMALAGLGGDEEARGARAFDFVTEADREHVRGQLWPQILRDGRWEGELRFANLRSGTAIPMHVHAFVIRDPQSGKPVAVATISHDISQRRRAEAELLRARDELAHVARVTAMGELTASITHEVNQPLAALVTNANACLHWLALDPPNREEARAASRRIIDDANRASEVLTRIRSFLTRGKHEYASVELDEAIGDVVALVQGQARAKSVTLIAAPPPGLPPVMGDRIQLQQVMLNLAINAIEAMGAVSGRERILEIGAQLRPTRHVRVYVSDTGPGIDAEERQRVFDPFYTTKPHGMGMGLAISRSIVESHGGELWVERNSEYGSTFQFTLPTSDVGVT